eukprot:7081360-Prymnesium_polylepis.1
MLCTLLRKEVDKARRTHADLHRVKAVRQDARLGQRRHALAHGQPDAQPAASAHAEAAHARRVQLILGCIGAEPAYRLPRVVQLSRVRRLRRCRAQSVVDCGDGEASGGQHVGCEDLLIARAAASNAARGIAEPVAAFQPARVKVHHDGVRARVSRRRPEEAEHQRAIWRPQILVVRPAARGRRVWRGQGGQREHLVWRARTRSVCVRARGRGGRGRSRARRADL